MAKVPTNISIDAETKKEAQALLSEFGMDLSTAVNVFLKQMVYEGSFPFVISRENPNATTIAELNEIDEMSSHPENYKSYPDAKSMIEDILYEA
jgi:DNA-damage-inducible protein J